MPIRRTGGRQVPTRTEGTVVLAETMPEVPTAGSMGLGQGAVLALVLVGVVAVAVALLKDSPLLGGGDGDKAAPLLLAPGDLPARQCYAGETACPGSAACRGIAGQRASPQARTPEGDHCCTFGCEGERLPVRKCSSTERICPPGQACRVGDIVVTPTAVTDNGHSCCAMDCNSPALIPTRDCFSGETLCPEGALCFDYRGNLTTPSAVVPGLGVCCNAAGGRREGGACAPSG
jgi:hypothetical protein